MEKYKTMMYSVLALAAVITSGCSSSDGDYPASTDIPGLFKLDGLSYATKFSGKVNGVGMVYKWRTTSETNPATGLAFAADDLYNTGNFLIFEK